MEETVKVHILRPLVPSIAVSRVMAALEQYAPRRASFVSRWQDAELVVLNVIGRQEKIRPLAEQLLQQGKQYAVIQYVLRSTQKPSTENWIPLWERAEVVWSYLDLRASIREDGTTIDKRWNFYHAPLGVSAGFRPMTNNQQRPYIICTSGGSYLTESVREAIIAAREVKRPVIHLGPELNRPGVTCLSGLTDKKLASVYSQCEFVSGLRRKEGFELPAAEGLLCGSRPILYDAPHYIQWYKLWAEFVPEISRDATVEALIPLFEAGARPVTKAERDTARERFDWKVIVKGFWKRCR